ncbi:MAG: hypothetical protein RL458_2977, partial [Pseudomonadota bacterium]
HAVSAFPVAQRPHTDGKFCCELLLGQARTAADFLHIDCRRNVELHTRLFALGGGLRSGVDRRDYSR